MTYYPKNKIQTNLFTNGSKYQTLESSLSGLNVSYNGYYYKLYNGKAYTGKFPGDGNNDELVLISEKPTPTSKTSITNVPPLFPTPEDYKNGYFTRYFKKKVNELIFEELTLDQFNNVYVILYIPFSLTWRLIGADIDTVYNINKNTSLLTEQKFKVPGFNGYLNNDYARYYK
jgi:hypothetical protein